MNFYRPFCAGVDWSGHLTRENGTPVPPADIGWLDGSKGVQNQSNLGWLKTALIAHGLDSFYSYSMAIQFSAIVRDPCPLDQVVGRTRNVVIWAQHHPKPLYGAGVMGAQSDVHQKKIRNWRSERICHAKTILRLWSGDSVFMLFATGRRLFSIIVLVCLVWRRLYGKHMADGRMYVS